MENKNYSSSFNVERSESEVYNAINNVRAWWSENIIGKTDTLNEEFFYSYKDVHLCRIKIIEMVENKKVVWLVLDNEFNFTKEKNEWKGNTMIFEIQSESGHTKLTFTQIGLTADYECFDVCQDAWTSYLNGSLKSLITTGKGMPNSKENDLNHELIEKWNLPIK
jgi:hypothetical protein